MHELAITESIFRIALREAQKANAKQVLGIRLCLGDYSDIVPDYVEKYFSLVSKGSIAQRAKISSHRVPAVIRCRSCEGESRLQKGESCCPKCGSTDIELLSGTECFVESIEVE